MHPARPTQSTRYILARRKGNRLAGPPYAGALTRPAVQTQFEILPNTRRGPSDLRDSLATGSLTFVDSNSAGEWRLPLVNATNSQNKPRDAAHHTNMIHSVHRSPSRLAHRNRAISPWIHWDNCNWNVSSRLCVGVCHLICLPVLSTFVEGHFLFGANST